ncbi:adenylate cyclase [Bradyrhizobium jicamae]|uniref:Adenylate cyclase n=1 Tax=Bradyrhizobium jicamae TaxID=280332 RepID=A0ABS5FYL1_9BRAD|nr:adenylate/guanylate cyclase domain-containing protein [Bradyrhizobium jicamae]MBR0801867.1 adenylate cyclase [Bradyrhizobium jicamae]
MEERVQRRLAAILAADVVGYSAMMERAEEATYAEIGRLRREVIEPGLSGYQGRLIKTTGDGILAEFASPVSAVRCAAEIQKQLLSAAGPIQLRIGINLGDVIVDAQGDVFGDGINIAARLESIADPGGILVSGKVHSEVEGKLDVAFEDRGEQYLKNISKPVRAFAVRSGAEQPIAAIRAAPALPDKPSIAVLPFQNMSGDPEQEYFADGMVEDIITALSRFKSLFVIARNSSFTYKGKSVDIKQVGRELGVRYVLEGSVRSSSNRVRITAQLIDAETGGHLWAERYDRDLADIFAVQDEITEAVAIAIQPAVEQMEQWRAVRKPPESLSSWEAYQRGLWHAARIGTADNEAAETFFRRAIDLDPSFAPAHAWLVIAILSKAWLYQTKGMSEALDEALPVAQKAISLDPLDAVAHCGVGYAWFFRGDHDGALVEARQALKVNLNYAGAHQLLGSTLVFSGHPREGIEGLRMAMRLDPNDLQRQVRLVHISMGYYFLRDYDAAADAAKAIVRSHPDLGTRSLAAALGQAGRLDEAKQALQKTITVAPKAFEMFVRRRAPWFRPEDHQHILEGLRKAGWEG